MPTAEIAATGDRVLVLEDTVELQCAARDHVPLRTRAGVVSMTELVRATMRLRPDRVIVGEVRGGEALDLVEGVGARATPAASPPSMPVPRWARCCAWSN